MGAWRALSKDWEPHLKACAGAGAHTQPPPYGMLFLGEGGLSQAASGRQDDPAAPSISNLRWYVWLLLRGAFLQPKQAWWEVWNSGVTPQVDGWA